MSKRKKPSPETCSACGDPATWRAIHHRGVVVHLCDPCLAKHGHELEGQWKLGAPLEAIIFTGDAALADAGRAIGPQLEAMEKPWECPVASTPPEPGAFRYPEPDEEIDIGVGMSTSGKVHIYLSAGGQRVAANFPLDWAETIRDRLDETIRACKREKNTP